MAMVTLPDGTIYDDGSESPYDTTLEQLLLKKRAPFAKPIFPGPDSPAPAQPQPEVARSQPNARSEAMSRFGINYTPGAADDAAQRGMEAWRGLGVPALPRTAAKAAQATPPPPTVVDQSKAQQPAAPLTGQYGPVVSEPSGGGGGSAIPRTMNTARGGGAAAPSPYDALIAGYDKREAALQAQMEAHQKPADYTQMGEYMKARGQTYLPMALSAALIGMGPRGSEGLAKGASELALDTMSPMKVEGGFIDPAGNAVIDPGFKRIQQMQFLQQRIEALDKVRGRAVNEKQHDAALAEQRELRKMQMSIAAADRAAHRALEEKKLDMDQYTYHQDAQSGEWYAFHKKDPSKSGRLSDLAARAGGAPAPGAPGAAPRPQYPAQPGAKATEDEKRTAYNLDMLIANAKRVNPNYSQPQLLEAIARSVPGEFGDNVANYFSPSERQITRTSHESVVDVLLWLATGAAYNSVQFNQKKNEVMPRYGDTSQQIADKQLRLYEYSQAARNRAGRAWTQPQEDKMQAAFANIYGGAAGPGAPPAAGGGVQRRASDARSEAQQAADEAKRRGL